jgi:transposase
MLMEQLDYNLLYRWFVGLNLDDSVWDVTVLTKNRERLLDGDIALAQAGHVSGEILHLDGAAPARRW